MSDITLGIIACKDKPVPHCFNSHIALECDTINSPLWKSFYATGQSEFFTCSLKFSVHKLAREALFNTGYRPNVYSNNAKFWLKKLGFVLIQFQELELLGKYKFTCMPSSKDTAKKEYSSQPWTESAHNPPNWAHFSVPHLSLWFNTRRLACPLQNSLVKTAPVGWASIKMEIYHRHATTNLRYTSVTGSWRLSDNRHIYNCQVTVFTAYKVTTGTAPGEYHKGPAAQCCDNWYTRD